LSATDGKAQMSENCSSPKPHPKPLYGGQCRRAMSMCPTRSACLAVCVEGLCLRALREHMVYLSALFCCTLTAMDACYSQFSTSARPSFCRSRCPPTALCLRAPKPGIPSKTPLYLYCIDTLQGFSGIFRDIWEILQGNSASLRARGAQSAAVKNGSLSQPLALGPPRR